MPIRGKSPLSFSGPQFQAVVAQLNKSIANALHAGDVKEKLSGLGMEGVASSPADALKYIAAERDKWGKVVKAANIRAD